MEARDQGSGIRCNEHPDAPHGFMRDASHNEGRYVCECEFWEPPKEKQKPVAHITGYYRGYCIIKPTDPAVVLPVGMALYRSPKEWVGLTVNEARDFYESDLSREDLIHKIDEFLEEKNHG